jgi:hypothetical protein
VSSETPTQSPLFYALHRDRYSRQALIREIENRTKRRLLVYVADEMIGSEDIPPFGDLLDDIESGTPVDLLLESPGGSIDQAEKIVYLIRAKARDFRVIVADKAKSAATLIALAANEIAMGYLSELGPIDPQVRFPSATGVQYLPARSFIDGLERIIKDAESRGHLSPAYYPVLASINPALLDACYKSIDRAKDFAKKWLNQYMLAGRPEQADKVANSLCDTTQYQSHGMAIPWAVASDLGLNVLYLDPEDDLWKLIWRLYVMYRADANRTGVTKYYESCRISLLAGETVSGVRLSTSGGSETQGPTVAVMPEPRAISVGSQNDLKPWTESLLSK